MTGQPRYAFVAALLERDFPPPACIIEFGSAPGDQIAALARRGYEATSVDLGAAEDEWGSGESGYFRRILTEAGVQHLQWDIDRVPFPLEDAAFDAALLTEVLEHLREYPARSLSEIHRVLRSRGRLYLTTPNAAYLMNRMRLLVGRSVQTPLDDWIGGLPHARHAREYTFAEAKRLLEHVGFRIVTAESRHFHLEMGSSLPGAKVAKQVLDRLARVRPTLGPSIVIVAEKG